MGAGGLASRREAWAWRKQASEEREGESFLLSSHLQACSPHPNPVWALFPTLVSLAPLADDPVPTLFLPRLQGSPEVKSGDQGSLWIMWWVVTSLKCIQLPAWCGLLYPNYSYELPWWLRKQRICLQCGRPRLDPWVREIPGECNGNPFQYSCLEKSKARGAWWSTVPGVTKAGHN